MGTPDSSCSIRPFISCEQLEPQAGERRKYRLRVAILRLDMGANFGLERRRVAQNLAPIGIAQPVIGIDALEAMNALTDRPLRRQRRRGAQILGGGC